MNRSIFQIKHYFRWYNFIITIIIVFILTQNYNYNCFSLKGVDNLLKEVKYKNITFKCSKTILDFNAINYFDYFFNNLNIDNIEFNVSKYYEIKNNIYKPFDKNSCYAHPNLFLGIYKNYYFNLQFSHKRFNNNFNLFTYKNDLFRSFQDQFLCSQFYVYDSYFNQQFLNYNSLNFNKTIVYKNNNSIEIQNYIDTNNVELKNFIKIYLK